MSGKQNTQSYDSDKENVTPSYRNKQSILSCYLDEKDLSSLSDISDAGGGNMAAHNTTTSTLNQILERVNVNDSVNQPDIHDQSDNFSEVSFDLKTEPEQKSYPVSHSENGGQGPATPLPSALRTPNSRRNPFDVSSIDHFPEISPNIFVEQETTDFKWSIDHISEMNPVDISEDQPSYILEAQKKEYQDASLQDKVKSYFENNVIAPSPFHVSYQTSRTVETQTNLSFPLDMDLEGLLEGKYCLVSKPLAATSDSSFRRMLFDQEAPDEDRVQELSEPDYPEELSSPIITPATGIGSPLSSDNSPSFVICREEAQSMSVMELLSPIDTKPGGSVIRTPGLFNTPISTANSSRVASTPHILMSTPGYSRPPSDDSPDQHHHQPANKSSNKRKLNTPDKLLKAPGSALQFSSPFISPIPRSLNYMKRHPKCPKKSRHDHPSSASPKQDLFVSPADSLASPAASLPSPASSLPSPIPALLPSPESFAPKAPMESSRIDSGTDVSSEDGEREKTKMVMGWGPGIQPLGLDISEIKPQDNSKKLRTNNYLDISDFKENQDSTGSPFYTGCCHNTNNNTNNNTCCRGNNTCSCGQQLRSKDSGFGTSSAMSTIASLSTLPPLSEVTNNQLSTLDARPGKRKLEMSPAGPRHEESGFYPPPVKRIVVASDAAPLGGRRKHRSLE